ncbi:hypothetical protein I317_05543 [Kwoniella heveanensis CBS 569]|nr:hypothetical protein I317_05543 [Kwoniella heveanensis CBS 569]
MSATATTTENALSNVADIPKGEDGNRVYVGNLSYSATEEQIREFVAPAGGEIASVTLPLRFGRRPAGYAFVTYKNGDDAKKAVEQLNEKEVISALAEMGDRKVKLEIAKPAEEVAELRKAKDEKRSAAREAAKIVKAEKATVAKQAADAAAVANASKEGETKPKKRKSKAKKPRRRLPGEGEDGEAEDETAVEESSKSASKGRIDAAGDGAEGEKKEKAPRAKKERKPRLELTGEESKNTIFVANLPFNVDDEALATIFTNLSINVKSAKIVKGIRRARPGSKPFRASKGFGFVELENESQQAEAVEKVQGTLIGDRQITAKVAKEMKPIEVEQAVEAETA